MKIKIEIKSIKLKSNQNERIIRQLIMTGHLGIHRNSSRIVESGLRELMTLRKNQIGD